MKVLITGSNGFIGRHLYHRLQDIGDIEILTFNRTDNLDLLTRHVERADAIVHLAGEMRPKNSEDLFAVNVDLTRIICDLLQKYGNEKFIILASSIQAEQDNLYGVSKRKAENLIINLSLDFRTRIAVYRLPHVFGKWNKPNYNSVIATFCHNIARGLPIRVDDPAAIITPVFIDDVVNDFISSLNTRQSGINIRKVSPEYSISVGDLAKVLSSFSKSGDVRVIEESWDGLLRALHTTYISYLPNANFIK